MRWRIIAIAFLFYFANGSFVFLCILLCPFKNLKKKKKKRLLSFLSLFFISSQTFSSSHGSTEISPLRFNRVFFSFRFHQNRQISTILASFHRFQGIANF